MKHFFIYIIILTGLTSQAQMYLDDAQIWFNLDLEKKLSDRWDLQLKFKGRATDNISQIGRTGVYGGLSYKLHKNVRLLGHYAYVQRRRNNDSYKARHQFYLSLLLKKDIGKWRFSYKNKLQARMEDPKTDPDYHIVRYFDRNKLMIKYEVTKRLEFFVAEEIYIPLNNPQIKGISRSRSYAGTFINVTKNQKLELYFLYQLQLQNGDWFDHDISYYPDPLKRHYVYGVGYSINF